MKLPAGCLDLVTWNIDDNLVNTVTYIVLTTLCLCIFHGIETDNRPIFCTQSTVIIYRNACLIAIAMSNCFTFYLYRFLLHIVGSLHNDMQNRK